MPPAAEEIFDAIVIGAGPAGLACGYELRQEGFDFLIVEAGTGVGESWRRMPSSLKLISPWKANWLRGTSSTRYSRHYAMSRAEFVAYLEDYAQQHRLPIRTSSPVSRVVQDPNELFSVVVPGGMLRARWIINATGYFQNPFRPAINGAEQSAIPQLHVGEYRDPTQLRGLMRNLADPVLIVGHRLSAGQTALELVQSGLGVALSHRSPLEFGVGPLTWWLLYRVFPWLEMLQLRWGNGRRSTVVKMQGGPVRTLIASGQVRTFPAITGFDDSTVTFADGQTLRPSAVIYATGFRPVLRHLEGLPIEVDPVSRLPSTADMESTSVPGLFFLGLDQVRNFQSRFLRGIRRDAYHLVQSLRRDRKTGFANCIDRASGPRV